MYCDYRSAISEIFRHVIINTHEIFVQNCVSFRRLHYNETHTDFRNHIYWDLGLTKCNSNVVFSLSRMVVSLCRWALQICLSLIQHKLEFLSRKHCSHLAHTELILNFLATVFAFVLFFSSVPSPCYINNRCVLGLSKRNI